MNQALQYMEATKALVLFEEFAEKRAKQSRSLKYRMKYEDLTKKMEEELDLEVRLSISDSLFYWLQQEGRDSISGINALEAKFEDLKAMIHKDEATYLNYFQHQDSALSIVAIGGGKSLFKHIQGGDWYRIVQLILEDVREHRPRNVAAVNQRDFDVFDYLIPFENDELPSRLVIVPDGILSYFPFEIIKDHQGRYLIEHSNVSYAFSLAMNYQVDQYPQVNGRALILAPYFDQVIDLTVGSTSKRNIRLSTLEFNRQEAMDIDQLMGYSRLFLDADATASHFFTYCGESPVIHVATHAIASQENDREAQILFSQTEEPGAVTLSEIYLHKIPANMVVMSACQTAVGHYEPGEGVMSFARAFTASGSKSVIASLWAVNDQSTAEIMTYFYQHLKGGLRKDVALRKAKLDYLDHVDPEFKDPYFWAGFIAVGDMSPINLRHSLIFWITVLSLLILIGLGFVFKFRYWRN